jgi:hypothetical protein
MADALAEGFLLRTRRVFLGVCARLPAISAVGIGGLLVFACAWRPEWRTCSLVTLMVLAVPLAAARRLARQWRWVPNRDMYLLTVGAATFIIVTIGAADPIAYSLEKTVPFVRQVEAFQTKAPGTVSFFRVNPDGLALEFMANLTEPLDPRFVTSIDTLQNAPGTQYIIATEAVFRSMPVDKDGPMHLLVRGRIGHTDCVMVVLEKSQNGYAGI